jgi:competence protein ComFC
VGAGETMELHRTDLLANTRGQLVSVTYSSSSLFEGEVKDLIVNFKYQHNKALARTLARSVMAAENLMRDCDLVTWIPTLLERKNDRGFDHAELLARHVGVMLRKPARGVLRRTSSGHQTGRSRSERLVGVSFVAHPTVRRRRILLLDDVITTGTTMREAAHALVVAGASEVACVGAAFVS